MKRYVHFPKVEGQASRQAHADLPAGTYEREISKEGFFGPAAHLYHRHPPTGWVNFEGPLRPHAFDCTKLDGSQDSPWSAAELLHNASVRAALLEPGRQHDAARAQRRRRRTAVRSRRTAAISSATTATCAIEAGDYILIPRGTMWRVECAQPLQALLIEATNNSYRLPDKGLVGPARDLRRRHARYAAHRRRLQGSAGRHRVARGHQAPRRRLHGHLSFQSAGCGGLARRSVRGAHQHARPAPAHEPPLSPAALGAHHFRRGPLRRVQLRAAAFRNRSGRA